MHDITVAAFMSAVMAGLVVWLVKDARRTERENAAWMVRHGFQQKGDE